MDINDYDYLQNSPFKAKKFHIEPLSREGVDKYNTKESYSHKFLKSMSHLRLEENKIEREGANSSQEVKKVNEGEFEEQRFDVTPIPIKSDLPKKVRKIHEIKINSNNQKFITKSADFFKSSYTSKNYFNLKKIKNHKKFNLNQEEQSKYSENYLDNYQNLGKSLKDFFKAKTKTSSIGFKSYEVPNINLKSPRSPGGKLMQERLQRTLPKFQNEQEENLKMKNILKTIKEYESMSKYPNMNNILSQGKIQSMGIQMMYNKTKMLIKMIRYE